MALFGIVHLSYLLALGVLCAWAIRKHSWLSRRLIDLTQRRQLFWILIAAELIWAPLATLWGGMSPYSSLPLEFCDIGLIVILFVLWLAQNHWFRAHRFSSIVYLAIPGPFLAMVLPANDPPSPVLSVSIFKFYFTHIIIVAVALHEYLIHKIEPTWKDYWRALAIFVPLSLMMLAINFALDMNFFFIRKAPSSLPFLEQMPFVFYLPSYYLAIMSAFALFKVFLNILARWGHGIDFHRRSPEPP